MERKALGRLTISSNDVTARSCTQLRICDARYFGWDQDSRSISSSGFSMVRRFTFRGGGGRGDADRRRGGGDARVSDGDRDESSNDGICDDADDVDVDDNDDDDDNLEDDIIGDDTDDCKRDNGGKDILYRWG